MTAVVGRVRRVLFVDDEPELRDAYRRYFGQRLEVLVAGSGAEAIAAVHDPAPDVLVLDMRLPDTDGFDVLQQIRHRHPQLPVVITTAYESTRPMLELLGVTYSDFLLKPYTLSELEQRIHAAG